MIDYGGFDRYDDESLWNYEAGVKSKFGAISVNAAAFYTDISNLQVTADAGSCSSRVVFNADAHTMGVEFELSAAAGQGPRPVARGQLGRSRSSTRRG